MDNNWPSFQTLESREPISHVLFATNSMILTTLGSGILSIWDAETGRCLYELGHEFVEYVAFSSNSELLATASATSKIHDRLERNNLDRLDSYSVNVWDTKTGTRIRTLASSRKSIVHLGFSPNSRWLAIASEDGIIIICDLGSEECGTELGKLHVADTESSSTSVGFSPCSTLLVALSGTQDIRSWTLCSGRWELARGDAIQASNVRLTVLSPDSTVFALLFTDGALELRESSGGESLAYLNQGGDKINCVAFSSKNDVAYATSNECSGRHTTYVWSMAKNAPLWKLKDQTSQEQILFSPDAKLLASTGDRLVIKIWDMGTGKCFGELNCGSTPLTSMSFSSDCSTLAFVSGDRALKIWDFMSQKILLDADSSFSIAAYLSDAISSITSIMPNLAQETCKRATYHTRPHFRTHLGPVVSLNITSNGNVVQSTSSDGMVSFFNVSENNYFQTLIWGSTVENSEALFLTYNHALLSLTDEWVTYSRTLISDEDRKLEAQNVGVERPGTAISMRIPCNTSPLARSRGGNLLAFKCRPKGLDIWHTKARIAIRCDVSLEDVIYVVFSDNELQIAAALKDGTIRVLDSSTGKVLKSCVHDSEAGEIISLAYMQDSSRLASFWDNGDIQIWDIGRERCLYRASFGGQVTGAVLFDDEGRNILTDIGNFSIPEAEEESVDAISNYILKRCNGFGISLDKSWITRNGRDWLWLPQEYRPTCSTMRKVKEDYKKEGKYSIYSIDYIGIGCKSGKVLLFKFKSN